MSKQIVWKLKTIIITKLNKRQEFESCSNEDIVDHKHMCAPKSSKKKLNHN